MNKCIWSHKSLLQTVKFVEQLRYKMRTWWHSNPTLTGCKISSNKVSKWPWWKWTNSRIIMSNLTTKSVPVFYFSFSSRAKLMVQERVGNTVPEVSAWTDSHVGCHLSPSDLVTCHLHIIVVVMTVAEMSSSTIRQTSKIKSCPHIYLVSLSPLCPMWLCL